MKIKCASKWNFDFGDAKYNFEPNIYVEVRDDHAQKILTNSNWARFFTKEDNELMRSDKDTLIQTLKSDYENLLFIVSGVRTEIRNIKQRVGI